MVSNNEEHLGQSLERNHVYTHLRVMVWVKITSLTKLIELGQEHAELDVERA